MVWRLSFAFLLVLFCPVLFGEYIIEPTLVPRFILVSFLTLLGYFTLRLKKREIVLPPLPLLIVLISFYLIHLISTIWALNTADALFESQKIILGIAVFVLLLSILNHEDSKKQVIKALAASHLVIIGYSLLSTNLQTLPPLFGHPNLLSSYVFLGLPFPIYLFAKNRDPWRYVGLVLLLLSLALLLNIHTRAVILALCISVPAGFLILWIRRIKQRHFIFVSSIILSCILGALFIWFASFHRDHSIIQRAPDSVIERFGLWEKSIQLANEQPVLGVGAGNWQYNYTRFGVGDIESSRYHNTVFRRPHNDFLWVLTETGIIGLLLLMAIIFFLIRLASKPLLNTNNLLILLLFSTLIGLMVISFFSFPRERIAHIGLTAFLLALLTHESGSAKKLEHGQLILLVVLALPLLFNLLVGFYRFKGEYMTKKIYALLEEDHPKEIIWLGHQAISPFYLSDPTCTPIYSYIGDGYNRITNTDSLLIVNELAYQLSPYDYKVLANYGYTLERLHYTRTAEDVLLEAHRINPHYEHVIINLAVLYFNRGTIDEAEEWLYKIDGAAVKYPELATALKEKRESN